MQTKKMLFMILACSVLGACSSHVKNSDEAENGLTVSQIYHMSTDNTVTSVPHFHVSHVDNAGYTRTALNETDMLFKPLNNPSVPLYVFPHVALINDEQILKPGYTTAFFLYKQNQYALSRELY